MKGQFVDHINGDKLDNRFSNLRICTRAENMRNRIAQVGKQVPLKGVSRNRNKYRANIIVDGKRINLGTRNTKEEAFELYRQACPKYHKDYANTGENNVDNIQTQE